MTTPPAPAPKDPAASKNWMGITALIVGIVGIIGSCCGFFGILFPAGAIVLGILSKNAQAAGEATNGKLGNVGFILGIIGVALSLLWGILGLLGTAIDWSTYAA